MDNRVAVGESRLGYISLPKDGTSILHVLYHQRKTVKNLSDDGHISSIAGAKGTFIFILFFRKVFIGPAANINNPNKRKENNKVIIRLIEKTLRCMDFRLYSNIT